MIFLWPLTVDSSLCFNEIRSMFRKLHNSFTDIMCNPFHNPGDTIQSKAFDGIVQYCNACKGALASCSTGH
uniref:Uncharacterized protein n=1 Tax=Astatotilapia calliptera TaxID=8154 RepID=A0AAX7VSY1_ASTCA